MNKKIVDLLYHSLDKKPHKKNMKKLENELQNSSELKKEKEQILFLRKKIAESRRDSFKPFFETRVMSRINDIARQNTGEDFFESLTRLFKPVLIAATVVIIAMVSYNISTGSTFSIESFFGIPQVVFEDVLDSSISYNME